MDTSEDLPLSATPADLMAAEANTVILFQAVMRLELVHNDDHIAALQHESDDIGLREKTFSPLLQEPNAQVGFKVLTKLPLKIKGFWDKNWKSKMTDLWRH